jgi:hypothetical protein
MNLQVYIGTDSRQPIAAQVLMHSICARASWPISITPLVLSQLPMKRRGLTEFTFSRYMVPFLSEYRGRSIFMDADMLCLADVCELVELADPLAAVSVVKNKLRFEWPSLMVFNNAMCMKLQPSWIDDESTAPQSLSWAKQVGELPSEWNHIVGYDAPRTDAKIVHFSAGIPCWRETQDCEYAAEWHRERKLCNSSVSWEDLMGRSVHREKVLG